MKKIFIILTIMILSIAAFAAEGVSFTATPNLTTLYFRVHRQSDGFVWDTVGANFEAFVDAQVANYDIALTEQGTSGYYTGALTGIDAAHITAIAYNNATPAITDVPIGVSDTIAWDGTVVQKVIDTDGEVTPTTASKTGYALSSAGNTAVTDDWETQSQADPTGFHVNLLEMTGDAQSVVDLKDLVDEGYDPTNNRIASIMTTSSSNSINEGSFNSGAISSRVIATDAIGNEEIATGAIRSDEIAANAIGSSEIADGAITDPKVANDVQVDVLSLGTDAQSLIDLKDFADEGYNPGTDSILLVDTVSTLTNHTPQTGDSFAALPTNFVDLSIAATTGIVDCDILGIGGNTTTRLASLIDLLDNMLNEANDAVLVDIMRVNDQPIENVNGKLKVVPGSF